MTHPNKSGMMRAARAADAITAPVNFGKSTVMSTQQVAGGVVLQRTQLITQRLKAPRQLLITLAPLLKGSSGTTPWYAPWNGTSTNPVPADPDPPEPFGAPVLPDPGKGLRVELRWGAGGASAVSQFDYPAAGGVFGVTADTLDLIVIPVDEAPLKVYTDLTALPAVGAWMVEGQAADPSPLQWAEKPTEAGEAGLVYYSVKPFARTLEIVGAPGEVEDLGIQVDWRDTEGALVRRDNLSNVPLYQGQTTGQGNIRASLEVPSQATYCSIGSGNGEGVFFLATWKIGLV